jgi:CTP:molybdopterin cytidylyltransferase MocA
MRIAALLVAAGSGSRFGAASPKQFSLLAGKPVIRWAAKNAVARVKTRVFTRATVLATGSKILHF